MHTDLDRETEEVIADTLKAGILAARFLNPMCMAG